MGAPILRLEASNKEDPLLARDSNTYIGVYIYWYIPQIGDF